jgi:choline dehydrogenase-like flavoprotein
VRCSTLRGLDRYCGFSDSVQCGIGKAPVASMAGSDPVQLHRRSAGHAAGWPIKPLHREARQQWTGALAAKHQRWLSEGSNVGYLQVTLRQRAEEPDIPGSLLGAHSHQPKHIGP